MDWSKEQQNKDYKKSQNKPGDNLEPGLVTVCFFMFFTTRKGGQGMGIIQLVIIQRVTFNSPTTSATSTTLTTSTTSTTTTTLTTSTAQVKALGT